MRGRLEVVYGPMCAGKTAYIIRQSKLHCVGGGVVQCFRPLKDTRCVDPILKSRQGWTLAAQLVEDAQGVLLATGKLTTLVVLDEVNMLGGDVLGVVEALRRQGVDVMAAGLNLDWAGRPWEPIPSLTAIATTSTPLHARCACGDWADRTGRILQSDALVIPGGEEMYEPMCGACYEEKAWKPSSA